MDKNEYSLKLEEIRKLIDQENYTAAAEAADQVDWRKVRNINTLCLISEVYEAVGRYEDSKALLVRAYKRTPVGRSILYRLVEVSVAQKQFDEAIQYYTEYVQAAPHDTNRYILKYKIYKGRGSSLDEQIDILKEYISEEYNEKYAYELARLYQQADRMEECIAACDDLVLWFHSGKYVIKALELKKRYAALTPKQQEIYDSRFSMEEEPEKAEDRIGQEKQIVGSENTTLADSIVADTEKTIAEELAKVTQPEEAEEEASAAAAAAPDSVGMTQVFEKNAEPEEPTQVFEKNTAAEEPVQTGIDLAATQVFEKKEAAAEPEAPAAAEETVEAEEIVQEEAPAAAEEIAEAEEPAAAEEIAEAEEPAKAEEAAEAEEPAAAEEAVEAEEPEEAVEAEAPAKPEPLPEPEPEKTPQQRQSEIAASMREIVGKVGRMEYNDPDEEAADELIEASKKDQEAARNLFKRPSLNIPDLEKKRAAGQLTLDDVLLSMGERGHEVREAASRSQAAVNRGQAPAGVLSAVDEALLNMGVSPAYEEKAGEEKEVRIPDESEGAAEPMTEVIPTAGELVEAFDDEPAQTVENEPAVEEAPASEDKQPEAEPEEAQPKEKRKTKPLPPMENYGEGEYVREAQLKRKPWDDLSTQPDSTMEEIIKAKTRMLPAEEIARIYHSTPVETEEKAAPEEEIQTAPDQESTAGEMTQDETDLLAARIEAQLNAGGEKKEEEEAPAADEEAAGESEPSEEAGDESADQEAAQTQTDAPAQPEAAAPEEQPAPQPEQKTPPKKRYLLSPDQQELFKGYLDVGNLDAQIHTAIMQAVAKGTDRTSRTGNVLIFGGHGSGKTTIGTNLAKAIAKEKGKQYVKMARIYATDLNRKDIAATVAKIAGGILLVEEAGDLDDSVADQLTTAMEFRTDGLIVILEDEQKYLHDLLLRHPRLTMKFTSEIHIPMFTTQEMVNFVKVYADDQDYVLSEEAEIVLAARIDSRKDQGEEVSVSNALEMVDKALAKANKASHRIFGGKKRFDPEGRIIVKERDLD